MWAILSDPSLRGGRWDRSDFFATGVAEASTVLRRMEALAPALERDAALEFGCGIGRVTQALAREFDHVIGVDGAPSMIEQARDALAEPLNDRCTFVLNRRPDLACFDADEFDFIYSRLVLQHIPSPASESYIREFARVLRPGGVAIFQVPSTRSERLPRWRDYVPSAVWDGWYTIRGWTRLEALPRMFGVPRARVEALISAGGGRLLEVADDDSAPGWVSFSYAITK